MMGIFDFSVLEYFLKYTSTAVWMETSVGDLFPFLDCAMPPLQPGGFHCALWAFSCCLQASPVAEHGL